MVAKKRIGFIEGWLGKAGFLSETRLEVNV
jgi:hypothetical protein